VDGKLFPIASSDFTFWNRETNDHVKRSLTWKDPELEKIIPVFFGTRKHFTFFLKPTDFFHPKTGYGIPSDPLLST